MSVLWPLEPATAAKHRLYRRYLDAWWPKMLQPGPRGYRRRRVTYVDAFAGPGKYEDGEHGSPVFVLERLLNHDAVDRMELSQNRVCLVFVEKDRARYEFLRDTLTQRFGPLAQLPVRVDVRHGDADQESRPDERWRIWLATYRDALRRAGFDYRLDFQVVPKTGQPLYLVFGTGNPAGLETMKDAMWNVDKTDGMSFHDPRVRGAMPEGQLTIWGGSGGADPELLELVNQRLGAGPASIEQLRDWLLCETARWRPKHAIDAVQHLRDEGIVTVEPAGRIVRKSLVRLLQ